MLRLLIALVAGIFIGGLGLSIFTDTTGILWIWPTTLPILILAGMLLLIGSSMRGTAPVLDPAVARALLDKNLGALARITSIKRTGTSVNDAPLCELDLIVATDGTDAYAITIWTLIDPVDLPRYQPGGIVTVVRLKPGGTAVTLVREPDAEWRRRMAEEAHRVPTTAPRADAEETGPKPIIGIGVKGRGARMAAYAALVAVGFAIVVVPNHEGVSNAFEAVRVGDDYDDYVNGDRQQVAVDALAEVIGGTRVTEVTFHADGEDSDGSVYANAPSSPGAATIDTYMFRDGEATRHEVTPTQPERPKDQLFDLAEIDLSNIKGLAAKTRKATGITEPDSELVRIARESPFGEAENAGPVLIDVSVQNRYYSGSVVFTLDGEVFRMSGGTPDSEASKSAESD